MTPEFELPASIQAEVNHKKDLKMFSHLGGIQSKVNFLHTCLQSNIIPKGFKIKWKEQTGLNDPTFSDRIEKILSSRRKLYS